MISKLNGSGSVRVHRKKAVFTGSRFRFGSTPCFLPNVLQHWATTPSLYARVFVFKLAFPIQKQHAFHIITYFLEAFSEIDQSEQILSHPKSGLGIHTQKSKKIIDIR